MATVMLRETALHFGTQNRLVAVLSLPASGVPQGIAVLLPNTGLDPRPGPNRLHVHIARALAAAGHPVLRVDLGGLGDSDLQAGHGADAAADLADAASLLEARGFGGALAVIGNCSGAHDAYRFAIADRRVTAVALIDGYSYDTPRHIRSRHWARLLRSGSKLREWWAALTGKRLQKPADDFDYFKSPPKAEARSGYAALRQRPVAMAFGFSGDIAREYSYADQHFDAFPELRGVASVWYYADSDHTFTRRAARTRLIADLQAWLARI